MFLESIKCLGSRGTDISLVIDQCHPNHRDNIVFVAFSLSVRRALPSTSVEYMRQGKQENATDMSSQRVKQTPSRVFGSVDVDFDLSMVTISPRILSPDLRHNSAIVLPAVYQ